MNSSLMQLASDFQEYKGDQKRVRYPKEFWKRAVNLCRDIPTDEVAEALRICPSNLKRHVRIAKENKGMSFTPVSIVPPDAAISTKTKDHSSPITIQFSGDATDLANFLRTFQGGGSH